MFFFFTTVFTSCKFVILLRILNLCDVDTYSATTIYSISLLIFYFFMRVHHLWKNLVMEYFYNGICPFYLILLVIFYFFWKAFSSLTFLWQYIYYFSHLFLQNHSSIKCSYFLHCVQYLFSFPFIQYLLLWHYVPQLWKVYLNWSTYKAFYTYYYYYWLDHKLIISHSADNLSRII